MSFCKSQIFESVEAIRVLFASKHWFIFIDEQAIVGSALLIVVVVSYSIPLYIVPMDCEPSPAVLQDQIQILF
uniref:Uncharacterized protein n=1 Tax=Romanomermis culicivorax TaxID=13658 RepID=A0A915I1S6_ROMCU